MLETEAAWAAGFMDGDGYFCFIGGRVMAEAVQAEHTPGETPDELVALRRIFGGSLIKRKSVGMGPHKRQQWQWRAHGGTARAAGATMRPYLHEAKLGQLDLALAKWAATQ